MIRQDGVIIRHTEDIWQEIMNTIGPAYALFVLQGMTEQGIPEAELFKDTQLDRQSLESGESITMDGFVQFLLNAESASHDPRVGLMIGRRSNILVLGPAGIAAAGAPTLRQGLQALEAFSRVHVSYLAIELKSHLQGLSLRIRFLQDLRSTERFHIESAVLLFQNYLETVIGHLITDAHYHMPFSKPDYANEYPELIHSPISFDAAEAILEVPRRVLDIPSPFFDKMVWQQSQRLLSERIKELTDEDADGTPYTHHVQALLQGQEPPLPNLNYIADQLHVSERTLNRRLQQEQTSFREIKAALTHHWAQQYLQDSQLSIDAIASALGYQDTANFRRAFRIRQKISPRAFREKMQEAQREQ
jgi:AraC-like DNA-binding protein